MDGLVGDGLHHLQFYQTLGQQPERPSLAAGGRVAAGQDNQVSFLPSIQLTGSPWSGKLAQGSFQAVFHEPLANPLHRGPPHLEGSGNRRVVDAVVSQQQDMGTGDLTCRPVSFLGKVQELGLLILREINFVSPDHKGCLSKIRHCPEIALARLGLAELRLGETDEAAGARQPLPQPV